MRIKTVEEQLAQPPFTMDNDLLVLAPDNINTPKTESLQPLNNLDVIKPTQQFANFFNSYAKAINKRYNRTGSLFEKHFGRIQVDSDSYFTQLVTYIHRNPQKHGFVQDFRTYPFSSYQAIRYQKKSRLKTTDTLNWFGDVSNVEHCHVSWHHEQQINHLIGNDMD